VLERFYLDLRYALRQFRRSPGFTAVATVVLAVAIGVNTASFGFIDALLFKPLDVHDPGQLVRVSTSGVDGAVSYPDYMDYRSGSRSLANLMAFTADSLLLRTTGTNRAERIAAYLVSDNYFDVLGVPPALGRGLRATSEGEAPGIVLSHAFWTKRFGADPSVLGRAVWLNDISFQIAGIAPVHFTGTMRGGAPHVFVPFTRTVPGDELAARGRRTFIAIGRLSPEVSVPTAQAELRTVVQKLSETFPETNRGLTVSVGSENDALFRDVPQLTYVVVAVFAMFGLLLAVACVNLAGLLTARSTFRQREIAIRATQGASRRAIVAQLLTESLVLATLGGISGLLLGTFARNLLWNRLQTTIADHLGMDALAINTAIDLRVSLFTLAVSAGSILLFGLLPALHASKDLYSRAKEDPSSPPPVHLARLRRFVGVQVMLSALLLALAGLLVQTVRNAASADLGYPLERAYAADLELAGVPRDQIPATLDRLLTTVRRIPGLEAAAVAAGGGPAFLPQSVTPGGPRQNYVLTLCSPAYFSTGRVPVLAGREFDARDGTDTAPVAVLNQRLAEKIWPSKDPIGRQLTIWDDKPPVTVVGVSKTIRSFPIGPPFYQIYIPLTQRPVGTGATLHLRLGPGQEATVPSQVLAEIRRTAPEVEAVRIRSLTEWIASLLAIPRALVTALGSLGAAALFLAAVGLYGVTAYVASRRAKECAIRCALGASRSSILWLLVESAMRTVLMGLGVGVALSLGLGFLVKSALLGAAFDPIALVVAPAILAATALLAIALPVFRAASLDTMAVLRED
jgi:predicted permease